MKGTFVTLEFPCSELSFCPVQSSNSNTNILPMSASFSAVFSFIPFTVGTIGLTSVFKMSCFYMV